MRAVKEPWSEPALDDLMRDVALDVKARAAAARERLASDPIERERVLDLLGENGYSLDDDQALISLSEHGPLLSPGDLMRPYEH
jgi:hypothetical protein